MTPTQDRHIIFIHLDLGIGGAEQLVINLALASLKAKNKVSIFTTHCSPAHCFNEVKPNGTLHSSLHVYGTFIPPSVFRLGTAFFSTIRILYITLAAIWFYPDADVMVLDVLPTSIPLLRMFHKAAILFYCHFPDKLLTRDTVNGVSISSQTKTSKLRQLYRFFFDYVEKFTMSCSDMIVMNSAFTKSEVCQAFQWGEMSFILQKMRILYPAIEFDNFQVQSNPSETKTSLTGLGPIVSLNRFERKKNVDILLHAYSLLLEHSKKSSKISSPPPLVIAGGYDPRNIENAQYMSELQDLAETLNIPSGERDGMISFQPNVSNAQRSCLLSSASCLCYTPNREHFGIVPIEAMYAGTPVIAVNSGGPRETVVDGKTGFLVENTPNGFYNALNSIVYESDDNKRKVLGTQAKEHVRLKFGMKTFTKDWISLLQDVDAFGIKRTTSIGKRLVFIVLVVSILTVYYS